MGDVSEASSTDSISFGIGCFHFGVRKTPPYKLSASDYETELRRTLEDIATVDKVEIDIDATNGPMPDPVEISESRGSLRLGDYFPHYYHSEMAFELRVPLRLQADLLRTEPSLVNTGTERFRVSIYEAYHVPVAFVECMDAHEGPRPSQGVIVVRDYLLRELERATTYLRFESLGPSPMHVNCVLTRREGAEGSGTWSFSCEREVGLGYDEVAFDCNPTLFKSVEAARAPLFRELLTELGMFYHVMQEDASVRQRWHLIQEQVDSLVQLHREPGLRGRFDRVRLSSRNLDDAAMNIAEFEMAEIINNQSLQKDYDDSYGSLSSPRFKDAVDKALREKFQAPLQQLSRLVNLFSEGRAKRTDIITLVVAAILGGAVGAILTAALARSIH